MNQETDTSGFKNQEPGESRLLLQATLDSLASRIAVLDEAGAIVFVNRAWRDSAAGNTGNAALCSDIGANYLQACEALPGPCGVAAKQLAAGIRDVIAGNRSHFQLEYERHNRPEKGWFIVTVTRSAGAETPDAETGGLQRPEPIRVVVTEDDVTERRRIERELRHTRRQYEQILNSISEGIHRFDKEGFVTYDNQAAIRMLGWDGNDLLGRPAHECVHHSRPDGTPYPKSECHIHATLRDGLTRRIDDEVFWRRDGSSFPVEYTCMAARNDQGEIEGIVVSFRDITDRLSAEARLHEGEMRLRALVESIDEIVFEFDAQGTYLNVWTKHDNLLAMPREQMIGRTVTEVLGESLGQPFVQVFREVIESGQARNLEYALETREGRHWFLARISPIFAPDGGCNRLCMLARDITERKLDEELQARLTQELQSEHQRLDDMLSNVPGVVWEAYGEPDAANPRLGYASPSVETMLGYTVAEWLTTPNFWLACMHPDDREMATREAERIFTSGEIGTTRYRWITKDGRTIWVEAHSTAIRDENGNPVGMRGVTMDITEQRQAEEQRDRFFQLSLDYLCIAGTDGYLKRVSPSFAQALGMTVPELLSKPFLEFVHPDDRDASRGALEALSLGLPVTEFQNRYCTSDGSYRWLEWRAVLVAEENLLYGAARDITERKQSETALARMRDELEIRVRERTAELAEANRGLQQAREEADRAREIAEEANRAKSEFLSRMSHELRTPMNAILGFGQVLEMRDLGPREKQGVAHILKAGRHLLELINEVLDISRIEAGKMTLSLETVKAADAVASAIDLVRPLAAERGIEIINEFSPQDDLLIVADRQRLSQVLLNILANAIKYNRQGGTVTITGNTRRAGDGEAGAGTEFLELSISDTGAGLGPDELARLFTPFERLGADQRGIEGTGIGLVLSRQLLEVMGGRLSAASEPGIGSTFTIEIPLSRSADKASGVAASEMPAAPVAGAPGTVLYIEDNLSNLTLVEHILEREASVSLISAMQGSIGLDLAHLHRPDLILLDLHLPDMGGEEVLRRLREEADTKSIPVVVLSADATPVQINRLMRAGVAGYLTKPLDIIQFVEVVTKLLNERGER